MRTKQNNYRKDILRLLSGFVPAAVICTIPAFLIWIDTAIFGLDCNELGIVEIAQTLVLLSIVVLCSILIMLAKSLRGGMILVTGFFSTLLIREQDALFDYIVHGFWVIPALTVTAVALFFAWRHRLTIRDGIMEVRNNHHFSALALGLFLLLGFSRVFGNKVIWKTICTAEYHPAKHAAEEGTELMAYAILLYWAISFFIDVTKKVRKNKSIGGGWRE